MQRKRRKKKRFGVFLFLLVVCIGIGIMFVPWAMQPENFSEVKNKINGFLYKEEFPDSYNAKSLILVDCSEKKRTSHKFLQVQPSCLLLSMRQLQQTLIVSLLQTMVLFHSRNLARLLLKSRKKNTFYTIYLRQCQYRQGMTQLMWLLIIVEDYFRRKQKAVKSV